MSAGIGRPSVYSQELADEICQRIADGDSLRAICEDEGMPATSTVHLWVVRNREGFSEQYAIARQAQALRWADEILAIADDGENDTYKDDQGNVRVVTDVVQRSRLRVDTRKWLLSKVLPKVYGDKQQLEHVGKGGGPMEISVTRRVVSVSNRIAQHVNGNGSQP